MTDTGEQGVTPQDPARRGGIGGGIVPDDLGEGEAQSQELAEHPASDEAAKSVSPDGSGSGTPDGSGS